MAGEWECNVCKKTYSCRKNLNTHMHAHAEEPQFECEICLRRFTFQTNLYEHKSVHTGKMFACPFRNCTKTCRLKGNLKKHMKVHCKSVRKLDEEYKNFTMSLKEKKKQRKQKRQQKRKQLSEAVENHLEIDKPDNLPENDDAHEPRTDNVREEDSPSTSNNQATANEPDHEDLGPSRKRERKDQSQPQDETVAKKPSSSGDNNDSPSGSEALEHSPSTSSNQKIVGKPQPEQDLGPERKRGRMDDSKPKEETIADKPSTSSQSGDSCEAPSDLGSNLSCCGLERLLRYSIPVRHCKENDTCRILKGDEYMCRKSKPEADNICLDCFARANVKNQNLWMKKVNLNEKVEETVDCLECGESSHKVCVFHFKETPFVCGNCSGEPGFKKIIETDTSCEIDAFLAEKANNQLEDKNAKISVASYTTAKSTTTKELMPVLYLKDAKKKYGSKIDYVARAIYFFQIVDNISIAFFGLFTQEYQDLGGKSWCVIDYLDSVPWMKVSSKSPSKIYLELILAYFEYMGLKGFKNGHLWANPPVKGVDYIFNIHPETQRYLDKVQLIGWYHKILQQGERARVLAGYRNFEEEFKKGEIKHPIDLPVFVDSLWCKILKWVNDELKTDEFDDEHFKEKLEDEYKERAEDNFFFELRGSQLQQPTPLQSKEFNPHKILGDRETFLDKCFVENWEFSSLRRAKYSSVGIIKLIEGAREERDANGSMED
ncbi:hypothetical protein GCK72_007528 [Caenorhabditis remanei]|uniref:histone acetyltransferase n=1 Tax=Caenorhabditis remanei TaxID=31234 RepID=A0A6A5HJC2_CAERE|nr:hypothetical protein GCK72_007528 [Caenorhabditis remanei]KAF1767569.1 hypothetical protein GCK72_007528 [Caenorhabditis remanei]